MAYVSTRKHTYETHSVSSTSTSGRTGVSDNAANHDDAMAAVKLTAITAGSVAFQIQVSYDDGTTWVDHPDSTAAIAALTTTGSALAIARCPIGSKIAVAYTITTGPVAFTVSWNFSKRGDCK